MLLDLVMQFAMDSSTGLRRDYLLEAKTLFYKMVWLYEVGQKDNNAQKTLNSITIHKEVKKIEDPTDGGLCFVTPTCQ